MSADFFRGNFFERDIDFDSACAYDFFHRADSSLAPAIFEECGAD